MFYRLNKSIQTRKLNKAISGILDTPPIHIKDAPWCIASMVANGDVPMYLLTLKSFYPKLGRGKVVAIIDRDMPQALRDTLTRHVVGLEFAILEDIPTGACQRGGTWERLLYVLDRSEREYTIQLDCDTLTVGDDLDEVVRCVETNTPFTMSDGFDLMPLLDVAEEADATPSNYIGIAGERAFRHYPGAEELHYVRGSSGFVGFSHGGFTRAAITRFHQEMEKLLGAERWREWGSEQCGSNFAIGNSPGAVVLPYPQYVSFTPRSARREAKFFHFIGAFRFLDDYYAARGQQQIAGLLPSRTPTLGVKDRRSPVDNLPFAFTRALTLSSAMRYLAWCAGGKRNDIWVRLRSESEFPGPEFQLRARPAGSHDLEAAHKIFIRRYLQVPVHVPPERVKLIVDLGAGAGMSCLYWLSAYWRTNVLACEPDPGRVAQCRTNLERNGLLPRTTLHAVAVGTANRRALSAAAGGAPPPRKPAGSDDEVEVVDIFALLAGRRIDILKIDIGGGEYELLEDPRFDALDVRVLIMEWHNRKDRPAGSAWYSERLTALGFHLYPVFEQKARGMMWGYRIRSPAGAAPADTHRLMEVDTAKAAG